MNKKKLQEQNKSLEDDTSVEDIKAEMEEFLDNIEDIYGDDYDEDKVDGMIEKAMDQARKTSDNPTIGDVIGIVQGYFTSESKQFNQNLIAEELDTKIVELFDVPEVSEYLNENGAFTEFEDCTSFFIETYELDENKANSLCEYVKEEFDSEEFFE